MTTRKRMSLVWLTVFALAMAYLEAAVVVYLRAIYYPEGFAFPLVDAGAFFFFVELGREAATIIMLWAVAYLTGRLRDDRLACFAYLFGVWDIGYYLWLKVTLDWPATLLDWDVLFLIPPVWLGPVLAPLLLALLMAVAGAWGISRAEIRTDRWSWSGGFIGCGLVLYSFLEQAAAALFSGGAEALFTLTPIRFRWPVFALGYLFLCTAIARVMHRTVSLRNAP